MNDPVRDYIGAVLDKAIVAGPWVRAWCKTFSEELDGEYGYDVYRARDTVDWYQANFFLGEDPLALFDWQGFLIGSVYGCVDSEGHRIFRRGYWETAKGSGKTPLAACVADHLCFAEGERRAEGYVIAVTVEQAAVTYRDAVAFIADSPIFDEEEGELPVRQLGKAQVYNMVQPSTGSFVKRLAAQNAGKGSSGFRPHCVVIDEYHEHNTPAMLEMMQQGFKARKQPLLLITTNSGDRVNSPCGLEHAYAKRVATGDIINRQYLPFVCALDNDDKDHRDTPAVWIKTNPSLPDLPGEKYVKEQIDLARGVPSREALVDRLQFCKWQDGAYSWLSPDVIDGAMVAEDDEVAEVIRKKGICVGAWDLSARKDLTAGALCWHYQGKYLIRSKVWTPEDTLLHRVQTDATPYDRWAEAGYIDLIPGEVMDFNPVAKWADEQAVQFSAHNWGYDPWRIDELVREFVREGVSVGKAQKEGHFGSAGITVHSHPQGYAQRGATGLSMPVSIDAAEKLLLEEDLLIEYSPPLRSALLGIVLNLDPSGSGNRRANKLKTSVRIDPAIAMIMAIGLCDLLVKSRSKWQSFLDFVNIGDGDGEEDE